MSFIWFSFYKAEFLESHMRPGTHICRDSTEKSPLLDRWSVVLNVRTFLAALVTHFMLILQPVVPVPFRVLLRSH